MKTLVSNVSFAQDQEGKKLLKSFRKVSISRPLRWQHTGHTRQYQPLPLMAETTGEGALKLFVFTVD